MVGEGHKSCEGSPSLSDPENPPELISGRARAPRGESTDLFLALMGEWV